MPECNELDGRKEIQNEKSHCNMLAVSCGKSKKGVRVIDLFLCKCIVNYSKNEIKKIAVY